MTPTTGDRAALAEEPDARAVPTPWTDRFALTVEFEVGEAEFEAFLDQVHDNAAISVEAEAGFQRFDVLVPDRAGTPRTVLLYEIYDSRAAFDAHLASDHYRRFDAAMRAVVIRKTVVSFRLAERAKPPARP